jgi:CheY-like chemotaxis protein/two-component sensor histidine kinase
MSHDLRTPLNAILGFAQILELASLGPEERESVTQILKGGQHLLQLINEVLDIARIEAGHLSLSVEPVNAGEIVQQAIELVRPLAGARGIAIDVHLPSREVVIRADRQRLNQVLLNLLSNAVKYNRPGGHVTVGIESIDDGRVRIAVTDTGPGIPPAKLALLFQPFERLGAEQLGIEGTGLGLALSRRLAEAMEGTLGVTSDVDRGSTFWIELADCDAVQPRAATSRDVRAAAQTQPDSAGLVLYIEDNHSNVRLMQRVLQRRPNVQLRHAATGADGIRMARDERPGLIFLDLHLPDMSGEDVLEQLWQDAELRRIPVAILSADATPAHPSRLKASGAIAYLTKPLEIREVIDLIDDRLHVPVQR